MANKFWLIVNREDTHGKNILAIPVMTVEEGKARARSRFGQETIHWIGVKDREGNLHHREFVYDNS